MGSDHRGGYPAGPAGTSGMPKVPKGPAPGVMICQAQYPWREPGDRIVRCVRADGHHPPHVDDCDSTWLDPPPFPYPTAGSYTSADVHAAYENGLRAGRQEAGRLLRADVDANPVPYSPDDVRRAAARIAGDDDA